MSTEEARARLNLRGLDPNELGYGQALNQLAEETNRQRDDQRMMNQMRVQSIQDQGNFIGNLAPNLVNAYRGGKDYARQEAKGEQEYNQGSQEMQKRGLDIEEARAQQQLMNSSRQGQTKNRREEALDASLDDAVLRRQEAAQRRKLTDLQIAQGTQAMGGTTHDRAVVQYRQAMNNPQLMAQLDSQYAKSMTPAEIQAIKGEASRPDYMAAAAKQAAQDATPEGQSLREVKTKANTYKTALTQMQQAAKIYAENQRLGSLMDTSKAKDATKQFADALRSIHEDQQADAIEANFAQRLASGDIGKTRSDVMHEALAGTAQKAKADLQASAPAVGQYAQDKQLEQTFDFLDGIEKDAAKGKKNTISPTTGTPVSYGINNGSPWGQNQPPQEQNPFRGAAQQQPQQPPPPGAPGGQMIYTGTVPQTPQPMQPLNPGTFRPGANPPQPGRGL